ncbi:MAG: TonB-dependent receptor, partial [bacterium]
KDKNPYTFLSSVEGLRMVTLGGSMQADKQTQKLGKISLGVDGKFAKLESNTEYKTSARSVKAAGEQAILSPFLRDEIRFLDEKLVATICGRLDWFKIYNGLQLDTVNATPVVNYSARERYAFSPSAGLVWHVDNKVSLRTAAGRSFNAPLIGRSYRTAKQDQMGTVQANPALGPEKGWSYEAGADWKPYSALLARLTLYYVRGTDYISTRVITPGVLAQYDNVGSVQTRGAEAELRWKVADKWSSSLAYTYNRAKVTADGVSANVGHDYLNSPRNKLVWGMDYDNPGLFAVNSRLRYKDKMFADIENRMLSRPYWTMDIGISRKIGAVEARLDMENLFNTHYDVLDVKTPPPLMAPGRVITGSFRVVF